MNAGSVNFYVIGGTLRADAPCYLVRKADQDLLGALTQGEFGYVLTSRQMGKSSLMVRTAQKLRAQGARIAVLDLTAIGQNLTAEQWYAGLMVRLGRQLGMEEDGEVYWQKHDSVGPVQRFFGGLRDLALEAGGPLVIFVDEIDVVHSLPFSTDEFFAAIRECFTRRAQEPAWQRLAFCLLGVATPSDLIKDVRMTPFNVARRIELRDFTEEEAEPLASALGRPRWLSTRLLRRILYWTGGHPYLTQRLCQAVALDRSVWWDRGVDRVCEEIFLSHRARERDDNLLFVRERLLRSEVDRAKLLRLYRRVHLTTRISRMFRLGFGLAKIAPVADEETNPLVGVLRLSGVTREERGLLKVRNRIYYRAFDRDWILANMPEEELWRRWVNFLRGVKRLLGVVWRALSLVFFVILIVFLVFGPMRSKLAYWLESGSPAVGPRPVTTRRSPTAPVYLLDLTDFYNASLRENWHGGTAGSLGALSNGVQTLRGIAFDTRGVVQLAGRELVNRVYPHEVTGIPARQKCRAIHFLHGTGWSEVQAKQIAYYVVHYADGQLRYVPVLYGQEVCDWVPRETNPEQVAGSVVAWEGAACDEAAGVSMAQKRRLFLTTWRNPRQEVEVQSIDFISSLTASAPFLVAITLEP